MKLNFNHKFTKMKTYFFFSMSIYFLFVPSSHGGAPSGPSASDCGLRLLEKEKVLPTTGRLSLKALSLPLSRFTDDGLLEALCFQDGENSLGVEKLRKAKSEP